MAQLIEQESKLLCKGLANLRTQRRIVLIGSLRKADFHFRFTLFLVFFAVLRSSAEIAAVAE